MHRSLIPLSLLSLGLACAPASDEITKDEARERAIAGKADHVDWCDLFDWYGDGICDEFCVDPDPDCAADDGCFVGGCSGHVCSDQPGVITTCEAIPGSECYQDANCERQSDGECGWTMDEELLACLPEPEFCSEGTIVPGESNFVPSADEMECAMPTRHCVTNDGFACPQFSPLPPDFCEDGTVVMGPSSFISSADGMECQIPSVHCVTNDGFACPQLSPLPPDFCEDGTVVSGPSSFISSADGMECEMPSVHCLTNEMDACPLF